MYKTKTRELIYSIIKDSGKPISALEILKTLSLKYFVNIIFMSELDVVFPVPFSLCIQKSFLAHK